MNVTEENICDDQKKKNNNCGMSQWSTEKG